MLKHLEKRTAGLTNPQTFRRQEASRIGSSLEPYKLNRFPRNHKGIISSLDVDGIHGQFLLAASAEGLIRIHNIHHPRLENSTKFNKKKPRHRHSSMKYVHEGVQCIQWYPKSISVFTSSGTDGGLKMWDVNGFRLIQAFYPCTTHKARVFQHHQSKVAKTPLVAVSSSEGLIPLVDLRFGSTAHRLRGHTGFVMSCKWSTTNEHLLATAGADMAIRLWDVRQTQRPLHFFNMNYSDTFTKNIQSRRAAHSGVVNGLEFTKDGNRLVSFGKDCTVRVWDVYNGKPCNFNCGHIVNSVVRHVEIAVSHNSYPELAYVPSGDFIYTLNMETGEKTSVLKGHNAEVFTAAYNPFYEELYSAGKDREIMVWKPHCEQTDAISEKLDKAARVLRASQRALRTSTSSD